MSYLINKRNRMKTKYSNILKNDFGMVLSHSPTSTLVICNGGLSNGVTYEMVNDIFEKYQNVERIMMVPGKSYSFVKFSNENSAKTAFEEINNKTIWSKMRGPTYLGFVENISQSLLEQTKVFKHPPGLVLLEDFITDEEETFILNLIGMDKNDTTNSAELKHRKVKHYGYEFKYTTNNIDLNEPIEKIPTELNFLWDRLKEGKDIDFIPNQLTINCYEPGQGIPPHVDTHSAFEDGIVSLSLESSVVMEFKKGNHNHYSVVLPKRSLCIMLGESRYDWTHGITPRKSDLVPAADSITVQDRGRRTSLTFRKTRSGKCVCKFPRLCDTAALKIAESQKQLSNLKSINLLDIAASELEGNCVHKVYDKIAVHFSETRQKPWPNVVKFIKSFDCGSILVDIGCGNGKYLSTHNEIFKIGCDSNNNLMNLCRQQGFECFTCNCLSIPLKDNTADGCICIAVIHHLTTEVRRRKAIEEIIRVMRHKGRALIYVWAKNQEREGKKSSYLKYKKSKADSKEEDDEFRFVSLNNSHEELILPVHKNRTTFTHSDLLVPWKLKTKGSQPKVEQGEAPVYYRFYHVYEDNELKNLCESMNDIDVLDYYYDQGNWCIILQKK